MTCLIWQQTCTDTGSCLLYDTGLFRNMLQGSGLGLSLLATACGMFGCWMLYKRLGKKNTKSENLEDINVKEEENMPLNENTERNKIKEEDEDYASLRDCDKQNNISAAKHEDFKV